MVTISPEPTDTHRDPAPHYSTGGITLHHGDCLDVLATLPDASVDAVVTDPPYGLEFMGKEWDGADGFRRSLNPADAGRDNAFGRTSKTSPEYRTASKAQASRRQEGGISQATGPSFLGGLNPKCLVCDRWQRGSNPCKCEAPEWTQERLVRLHSFQEWCEAWSRECLRVLRPGGYLIAFGGTRTFHRLACAVEDVGFEVRDSLAWLYGSGFPKNSNVLKPAFEPIVAARRPLAGTVAANVAKFGTGELNTDACRIDMGDEYDPKRVQRQSSETAGMNGIGKSGFSTTHEQAMYNPAGRYPSNVLLDVSQAAALDEQSGVSQSRAGKPRGAESGEGWGMTATGTEYSDTGGASRFFYVAKPDRAERPRIDGVAHPTVKPLELMRWLVRLVTPAGGIVVEPFAGSGTTAEACLLEGFRCIAIEREADYLPLIVQRLNRRRDPAAAVRAEGGDGGLFDLLGEGA